MFDLFNIHAHNTSFKVVEFCGKYAIVSPFGAVRHNGKRKHIVYTWNKRFATNVENTIGSYWRKNQQKWLKVAYGY
jgi:hypothetical protein